LEDSITTLPIAGCLLRIEKKQTANRK